MERNWKQSTKSNNSVINQKISSSARYVNRFSNTAYYGGELVCESIGTDSDLKLIIAAPKLLDACKQFVNAAEADSDDFDELKNAYKSAKIAINIAEPVQLLLPGYACKENISLNNLRDAFMTVLDALEMVTNLQSNMWSGERNKLDVALAVGRRFEREILGF